MNIYRERAQLVSSMIENTTGIAHDRENPTGIVHDRERALLVSSMRERALSVSSMIYTYRRRLVAPKLGAFMFAHVQIRSCPMLSHLVMDDINSAVYILSASNFLP